MKTAIMPSTKMQRRPTIVRRLINMLDLSQCAANAIYNAANIALIVGGVLVLMGTIAAIWSSGIRERYADERISSNEAKTAQAVASAAIANEQAADAGATAAIANRAAADAGARVADANKAAKHERLERMKLEALIA